MMLIKCSKCSADIPNKAGRCPKCGAPVVVHKWICSKCGNTISEEPCPYCSNAHVVTNTSTIRNQGDIDTTSTFVINKKRTSRFLVLLVLIAVIISIFFIAISKDDNSNSKKSVIVNGKVSDFYDDDGDGWVDRTV